MFKDDVFELVTRAESKSWNNDEPEMWRSLKRVVGYILISGAGLRTQNSE
ncbi:MAG: hypothetical protein QXO54_00305 [Candidatus Methanomethylicaceae archaeon]|nr:hypothetical protein [Candidatus Verstraetearchaeota archaeon]